jgi:hypothetical protein
MELLIAAVALAFLIAKIIALLAVINAFIFTPIMRSCEWLSDLFPEKDVYNTPEYKAVQEREAERWHNPERY